MKCRICNTKAEEFLDLGTQPIANHFIDDNPNYPEEEFFYRLKVYFCPECFTVQIGNCPDKEMIFNDKYAYFTSTSKYMIRHFESLADEIKLRFLPKGGRIVEIGSNDGTFLQNFDAYKCLGIEPSSSVDDVAREKGLLTWTKFFSEKAAEEIIEYGGRADVIASTNVFPHMHNRDSVLKGIKKLLKKNGVWINEEASLSKVMLLGSYDQFYNEHVFMDSIASFESVMRRYNLRLFDVEYLEVHGGSIRTYVCHENFIRGEQEKIRQYIKNEKLTRIDRFLEFGDGVKKKREDFLHHLLLMVPGSVVGYGATAKSTTILNYCNVGKSLVRKIYDNTPIKQGKLSPGMHIPIVPYYEFERDNPKDVVLFAWNHAHEIYEKEKGKGIRWILPI